MTTLACAGCLRDLVVPEPAPVFPDVYACACGQGYSQCPGCECQVAIATGRPFHCACMTDDEDDET